MMGKRGIPAEYVLQTHTHAHIAMKVKRKEWSWSQRLGKEQVWNLFKRCVCGGGWVTSNWESRDIRRDWRVVFRNGFVNQMLPANGCFARRVAVSVLSVVLEKRGFLSFFLRREKREQKVWCGSWYIALLKGVWYDDFPDFYFNIF